MLADRSQPGQCLLTQRSTISVYSAETGECLGLLDGRALTRQETAAVTALASRTLEWHDSRRVALIGAGALAEEHAHALAHEFELDQVRVWSRSTDRGAALAGARRVRAARSRSPMRARPST